jgi:membrane protein involved in colicin uptake
VNQVWINLKQRTAENVLEGIKELERQRAEAQERGDQEEAARLEQLITAQREGVEELRGTRPPKSYPPRGAPGVPAEPPRQ